MKRIICLIMVTMLMIPVVSSGAEWKLLGVKKVQFIGDQDEIQVGAGKGTYKRIKLTVKDGDVEFGDVTVVFGNGERFDVPMRSSIKDGGETRVIDLPGKARVINKIVLVYKSKAGGKSATVSVWGLKD